MDKETKKEIEEIKKSLEIVKFSVNAAVGAKIVLEKFESGEYGEKEKRFFKNQWNSFKKDAERLGLLD